MPKQYVQRYLEKGILQKISMTRFEIPEDETERIGVNYGVEQTYEERIIHKPIGFLERKKMLSENGLMVKKVNGNYTIERFRIRQS